MVLSYYVSGNTAAGRINLLESNLEKIDQVIVLQHPSAQVKTKILCAWMNTYLNQAENIELLESVEGKSFLDGCILRSKKLAIVSDTVVSQSVESTHTIHLSSYILETENERQQVDKYQIKKENSLKKAWESFATGLQIHDELEHIYIQHMDFDKADQVAADWKEKFLPSSTNRSKRGSVVKRLFGTNTPEGSTNVVSDIIRPFPVVHHVKGRAGTGKSFFMNGIAEFCITLGYDIEQYVCSFDPDSTDMIIVPELDICLFDSTSPHVFTPKQNDVVIDLYEKTVEPGIDETYQDSIQTTTDAYTSYMKKGNKYLKQAHESQEKIDNLYIPMFPAKVIRDILSSIQKVIT